MTVPVRQVMRRPRFLAMPHTHISDAFEAMSSNDIRHLPVVDESGALVGILDERSLMIASFRDPKRPEAPTIFADVTASEIMFLPTSIASPDAPLSDLIITMLNHRLTCLPVVDEDDRLCGLLTRTDVISALCAPPLPEGFMALSP